MIKKKELKSLTKKEDQSVIDQSELTNAVSSTNSPKESMINLQQMSTTENSYLNSFSFNNSSIKSIKPNGENCTLKELKDIDHLLNTLEKRLRDADIIKGHA